jgi:two-component system nitrogen regulation response regulator GlnG
MGSDKTRPKILCVEDEPETCKMLQVLLPDFEIIPAGTKLEAIQNVMKEDFSLIFMDYYLPDGTGEEACLHIRHFDQRTPILFITGSSNFTATNAVAIGAQGVLKKAQPTFIQELRERTLELTLS